MVEYKVGDKVQLIKLYNDVEWYGLKLHDYDEIIRIGGWGVTLKKFKTIGKDLFLQHFRLCNESNLNNVYELW